MKKNLIMAIALLALLGCASNKAVVEKSTDSLCEKLLQWTPELREMSKNQVGNEDIVEVNASTGEIIGKIECIEAIECNKEKYCITYTSPSMGITSFFDPVHHK